MEDVNNEDLLRTVEQIEHQQSDGGSVSNREGYFKFNRIQFREKNAKSYGIKRTLYHLKVQNLQETFPVGHGNIIRAFQEGLVRSIQDLRECLCKSGPVDFA